MQIAPEWEETIQELTKSGGIVLLVGAADTGKTTLTSSLAAEALAEHPSVAIVDADLGQSTIGPPTTIGLSVLQKGTSLLEEFPAHDLYFVGDTSPFGHILQSVVGTKRMVEEALSFNPFLVIVDTSGLVTGAFGQALKYYKAQAINPDHIVSLQRGNELREILYTLSKSGEWKLHNLPVSSKAKHISPLIRAGVRRERFRRYFGRSNSFSLNLAGISLYPPLPDFLDRADLLSILVSLKNRQGRVLGIGILKELIPEQNRFEVLAPIPPESEIFGMELGFLKVSRDGRELGRAHHHK